jgi:hypothetical protein
MKKIIITLVGILIVVFVSGVINGFFVKDNRRRDTVLVDKITDKTEKTIKKNLDLQCIGLGGGMMKGVESLRMDFMSKKPFDVKTGRRLVVKCVREYLKNINDCKELTSYLINVPFTAKNIDVVLFSPPEIDTQVDVYYIACREGLLRYEMYKEIGFNTILRETYEEALKIVEEEERNQ